MEQEKKNTKLHCLWRPSTCGLAPHMHQLQPPGDELETWRWRVQQWSLKHSTNTRGVTTHSLLSLSYEASIRVNRTITSHNVSTSSSVTFKRCLFLPQHTIRKFCGVNVHILCRKATTVSTCLTVKYTPDWTTFKLLSRRTEAAKWNLSAVQDCNDYKRWLPLPEAF